MAVKELNKIKLTKSLNETPKIGLVGEIYVRRNPFSSQFLIEKLAEKGIITKVSPGAEWIYYCDYIVKNKLVVKSNFKDIVKTIIKGFFKNKYEKIIKNIFNKSKLYDLHMVDVDTIINNVSDLISPKLTGEAILTIGASITEIVEDVEGVISIGPFGCMPSRISEAILNDKLNEKKKENIKDNDLVTKVMEHYPSLPFLAIETDGNPFSQIIESKLESFCLQVKRISELTLKERILHKKNKL